MKMKKKDKEHQAISSMDLSKNHHTHTPEIPTKNQHSHC